MHKIIIIGILLLVIFALPASYIYGLEYVAYMPTSEKLKEVETDHFHIIFQDSLQDAVPYLAQQCEEAYQKLTFIFGWFPQKKIEVFFIDAFDTHNGWATSIPHNRMTIYAAGAEPGSSIFQPGNYIRRTIYHELAHVLSTDMRYGYNWVLSSIFGKISLINNDPLSAILFYFSSSPVALAPEWYLEGIAIYAETEFAPPGRGRMSIPNMIFRCAVNEGNLLSYNNWDMEMPNWPYGLGAYLYGMKLIQYVYETSPADEPIGDLLQNLAHAFMFNFNEHSVAVANWNFEMLAQKMLQQERNIQTLGLKKLRTLSTTKVPRLTNQEIIVYQPIFVGNRIYFIASEEEARDSLYVYIPEENRMQKIADATVTGPFGSLSASHDHRCIYYTRLEIQNKDNYWYEVRCFDTERGKDTFITDKGRYRAIDVSPDGRKLVAVSMRAGKSYLIETPIEKSRDSNQERILASSKLEENFASPRYSPDGKHIVYAKGNKDGFSLIVFDREKEIVHPIYHSRCQLIFPTWSLDNKKIIFSSDENGVYNLYEISKDGKGDPIPLTHVIGGIFSSDISPNGQTIAAVAYDSKGYYLTVIPYTPQLLAGKKLPSIIPQWKSKERGEKMARINTDMSEEMGQETQPYSSFKNIQFDYWGPWLTASSKGIMGGIGALFSDPTGYQNLRLVGGIESKYETEVGSVHYIYKGFYPVLHLFASQEQWIYPDLLRAVDKTCHDYAEEIRTLGTAIDIPFIKSEREISLQIGYQFRERDFIEKSKDNYQGKTILTKNLSEESEGAIWTQLRYFNGIAFRRSNSIEDGRLISVTIERTDTDLGGTISQTRTLGEWNEYISNPWPKNHVLKLSGVYGFGEGEQTAQGLFGLGSFEVPIIPSSLGLRRTIFLRGYEENFQTGDRIAKLSCAYRFPILYIYEGVTGSTPIYYKQLFAEIFYEGGRTWDKEGEGDDRGWINAVGLEVNFSLKLLRFIRIAPGLGLVFTPDRSKRDPNNDENVDEHFQLYFTIKGFVNF